MSYNILAASTDFTVVSEYIPEIQNETAYQSEDALEKEFIAKLKLQGYEYLEIHKEEDLISNLRTQIENLKIMNGNSYLQLILLIKTTE